MLGRGVSERTTIGRTAITVLAIAGCANVAGCANKDPSAERCDPGALLTHSPVVSPDDIAAVDRDIASIAPLGDFAVPGHVFPASHVDFYLRTDAGEPIAIDVFAPARISITRLSKKTRLASDGQTPLLTDYRLDFSVCQDVTGQFILLQSLSEELGKHLGVDDQDSFHCTDTLDDGVSYQSCEKAVRGPTLEAGSLIGSAGRPSQHDGDRELPPAVSLGFGLLDARSPNTVANPHRWQPADRTFVCPFDYFAEGSELQNTLYDKLGAAGMPRDRPPACGTAYWDEPNTARGVWFVPGLTARPEDPHVTLAYYNMDGQSGVFALGSSVYDAATKFDLRAALGDGEPEYVGNRAYLFTPGAGESRDINTPFEDITRGDPMIHCYEHLREQSGGQPLDAVILLALNSKNELSLEVVPGGQSCVPRNERRFGESLLHYER